MAFRASNTVPVQAYERAKNTASRIKNQQLSIISKISGGANADVVIDILRHLVSVRAELEAFKAVPNLAAYAKAQESDDQYDVVVEFNALIAAIQDAEDWIKLALPVDQNGFLLIYKLINNQLDPRQFTSTQIGPLVIKLQTIVDAVE